MDLEKPRLPVAVKSTRVRTTGRRKARGPVGHTQALETNMTAKEFLDLSTKLFADMKAWIGEAAKDDTLSASDLAMLSASMKIIERVTLKEVEIKPETGN